VESHQTTRRQLTTNRLLTAIVFIAVFVMGMRYPAGADTWWHLRAGEWMLTHRQILTGDVFSFTRAGAPWIDHGWLAQLFWAVIFRLGGWQLLGLTLAAVVTATFAIVWKISEGNIYLKAFAVILAATASSIIWTVRPQMLSFLFTAVALMLLENFRRRGKSLLPAFPLLMLLWVNVHGGFAIGFILLIMYLAGEAVNAISGQRSAVSGELKKLSAALGISLLVVPLNPNGWQMWLYPFRTVGIGALRAFIAEWQSPDFHQPIVQVFLLLTLALIAAIARSGKRMDWTDLALFGGWLTLSMVAVRNVAIFAVVSVPLLVRYGSAALESQFGALRLGRPNPVSKPMAVVNWVLLGLLLLATVGQAVAVLSPAAIAAAERERFPADAVAFIRENRPAGNMFNTYNIGGYLLYQLYPDYPVFVDGRTDLYDDAFLRQYLRTMNGDGWEETFRQYDIRLAVLERGSPLEKSLAAKLNNHTNWQILYQDTQTIILVKQH